MGYFLVKQPEPFHRWRVSFAAGVLRVSSKLGSSHRTLTTPVEAYAPPCGVDILPFWRGSTNQHFSTPLRGSQHFSRIMVGHPEHRQERYFKSAFHESPASANSRKLQC
jgi:hypothetical protein